MNKMLLIVILALLCVAGWWLLRDDPEAEVRDAHQALVQLLSKAEGEATGTTIVNARILQSMFANNCDVTGAAEMFAGSYTPEEMVSTTIRVQGMFLIVDLAFHEMVVEFPADDDAISRFTAVLVVKSQVEGELAETRNVISRMRNVDGKWLFSEFRLAKVPEAA